MSAYLRDYLTAVIFFGVAMALVAGVLALYSYFLGARRRQEDRIHQVVPPSLLRCPFVVGLLAKKSTATSGMSIALSDPLLGESRQHGS